MDPLTRNATDARLLLQLIDKIPLDRIKQEYLFQLTQLPSLLTLSVSFLYRMAQELEKVEIQRTRECLCQLAINTEACDIPGAMVHLYMDINWERPRLIPADINWDAPTLPVDETGEILEPRSSVVEAGVYEDEYDVCRYSDDDSDSDWD